MFSKLFFFKYLVLKIFWCYLKPFVIIIKNSGLKILFFFSKLFLLIMLCSQNSLPSTFFQKTLCIQIYPHRWLVTNIWAAKSCATNSLNNRAPKILWPCLRSSLIGPAEWAVIKRCFRSHIQQPLRPQKSCLLIRFSK